MTEYKDEIIKKAEEEKAGLEASIKHANEAITARLHLNYLDKLNHLQVDESGQRS